MILANAFLLALAHTGRGSRRLIRMAALLVAVGAGLCAAGCAGLPSLVKVQESFQREHPHVTIVRTSGQLDGNGGRAEFHIFYTELGNPREHEEVRSYYCPADAGWLPEPARR